MILPRTNIQHQLNAVRAKKNNESTWRDQVQAVLKNDVAHEEQIIENLNNSINNNQNNLNFDQLETEKIYHLAHIKNICIDYRLRFLDAKYFKGKLPKEAIFAIKELENKHEIEVHGLKIIAPSKLFKLENADDPLLFAPMGNDYFYLVHKWGNDLHPLRKLMMWFFKSMENLLLLTFLVSLLLSLMVPNGLFSKEPSTTTSIILFLFMFKWVSAIVIFYGFSKGKNFNPSIWNSKYFNA